MFPTIRKISKQYLYKYIVSYQRLGTKWSNTAQQRPLKLWREKVLILGPTDENI